MYISLNKKKYQYNPDLLQSIYSIKQDINNKILKENDINIKTDEITLYYNETVLEDNKTPFFYKIRKNDTLYIKLKKDGGATAASVGGLILAIIIILVILLPILFFGIMPFISFLISKILIKGMTYVIDFLRGLTDYNSWLNSFLATLKSTLIPFISFILYYGGLAFISYYIVFFSTYGVYNFIFNDCRAFKASKLVGFITVAIMILFYVLSNIPNIIKRISAAILPGFINGVVQNIFTFLSNLRLVIIGAIPFMGGIITALIQGLTTLFELLNKSKFYGPKILYEWDKMYAYSKQPDVERQIREMKLSKVADGVGMASEYERGKTIGENPFTHPELSAMIFLRFAFQTGVYMFMEFVDIFDICGDKPETLLAVEQNIKKTNGLIKDITSQLNDPSVDNSERKEMRQALQDLTKTAAKLYQNKEKEEKMKILDVDCLREILINGAFGALPTVLIFLIIFIIFCIPGMIEKVG